MKFYLTFCILLISFINLLIKGAEISSNPEIQETTIPIKRNSDIYRNNFTKFTIEKKNNPCINSLKDGIERLNLNVRISSFSSVSFQPTSYFLNKLLVPSPYFTKVFRKKEILPYNNEEDLSKGIEEVACMFNRFLVPLSSNEIEKMSNSFLSYFKDYFFAEKSELDFLHFHIFCVFYADLVALPHFLDNLISTKNKDSQKFYEFLNNHIDETTNLYDRVVNKILCDARNTYGNESSKLSRFDFKSFKPYYLRLYFTFSSLMYNFCEVLLKKGTKVLNELEFQEILDIIENFASSTINNKNFFMLVKKTYTDLLKYREESIKKCWLAIQYSC